MTYYKDKVKFITLKDLYLSYRHKWYDVNSSTVPIPYFSSEEISEHEYKLTYKQWKEIVQSYLDCVLDELKEGNTYTIPHGLGVLQLVKYENRYIDYEAGKKALEEGRIDKGTFLRKKDYALDGYAFKMLWHRSKKNSVRFRNKYLFEVWMPKTVYSKLYKWFKEDKSRIYKLSDN